MSEKDESFEKDKSFKTITVKADVYTDLNSKLEELKSSDVLCKNKKISSIGGLIELLLDHFISSTNLNAILYGSIAFKWPSEEFNKLFSQMEIYKSTEWIRSPDHAQVGKTQLPAELMTRIKAIEPFRFEKTLIISEDSWNDPKTWEWIWEVFLIINDNPGKNIVIRVIQEKKIREKHGKETKDAYFDMGIYKMVDKQFVGFLTSKDNSLTYKWEIGEKCYKDAEKQFDDLNSCAEQHKDIINKLTEHVIAKRLGLGS